MELENKYCGQCGCENPYNNNFCTDYGQKLKPTLQNDLTQNTIQSEKVKYNDIRLALEQLIKTNGFIIISKGDYYVQFASDLNKGQLHFEAVSQAFLPKIGNKDVEFSNLLFTVDRSFFCKKNSNYLKIIPFEKISVKNLLTDIDFIFNKIYAIPLNNYEIKIETENDINSEPNVASATKGTGCLGTLLLLLTIFSFGSIFFIMLLFLLL